MRLFSGGRAEGFRRHFDTVASVKRAAHRTPRWSPDRTVESPEQPGN